MGAPKCATRWWLPLLHAQTRDGHGGRPLDDRPPFDSELIRLGLEPAGTQEHDRGDAVSTQSKEAGLPQWLRFAAVAALSRSSCAWPGAPQLGRSAGAWPQQQRN